MKLARRRCSKSPHESLTEINITPLLDLGFVLLVIFIMTTTPLVNGPGVSLPTASLKQTAPLPKANYVTVESSGAIHLNKKEVNLDGLLTELGDLRRFDPDLSVIVRGDSRVKYRRIAQVMDVLQQANVLQIDLATEPLSLNSR